MDAAGGARAVAERSLRTWLREPLLHFLVVGAAIFALYRIVGGDEGAPREIVVSEAQVEALAQNFSRTWMRPPTAAEVRGMVDDYVKEEIYYREAIALGLDRDDTVIRRRLRQKMEFVSDDVAAAREPTEADLAEFLQSNAESFADPPSLSFRQVFFSSDRRGASATSDARQALERLAAVPADAAAVPAGDPTLLPPEMSAATSRDVANVFGEALAAELETAPVERWVGPFESPFGVHLVWISARAPGRMPPLAEIRPAVVREWQAVQQRNVNDALYEELRRKYQVRIEGEIGELLRREARGPEPSAAAGGRS
jgi:PPIC-type PPIASE domain